MTQETFWLIVLAVVVGQIAFIGLAVLWSIFTQLVGWD